MKYITLFFLSCTVLGLAGCQTLEALHDDISDVKNGSFTTAKELTGQGTSELLLESPCPQVELVDDLSSISDFSDPNKKVKANLVSRVDLKRAESACKLASNSAIIDLKLIFNGSLGAKGRMHSSDKPFFSYPFFVAVTAPSGKIMAKEIFAASLTYGAHEDKHSYFEKLRQVIPIKNKSSANRYKILIGFQLTKDQLAYNRKHMVSIAETLIPALSGNKEEP